MTAPTQTTPFPLRMPPDLREQLEGRAKANGRSTNSEIVAMISASLDAKSDLTSVSTEVLLAEVLKRLGASVHIVVPEDKAKKAGIVPKRKPKGSPL